MAEAKAAWRIIERAPRPTGGGLGFAGLGVLGDSGVSGVATVMAGSEGVRLRIVFFASSAAVNAGSAPPAMTATMTSTPTQRPTEAPPPPPKRLGRPDSFSPADD